MNKLYKIILFCSIPFIAMAQQTDDYKFNFENQFINNPAIVAPATELGIGAYYLRQFSGIQNAPEDIMLSFQSPIPYQNAGVGLAISNESAGLLSRTNVNLSGNYKLRSILKPKDYLAMGLSFNASQFRVRGDEIRLVNKEDPFGILSNENAINFNVGAGMYYRSANKIDYRSRKMLWQVGLSAGKALPQSITFQNANYTEQLYLHGIFGLQIPFAEGTYFDGMLESVYENTKLINANFTGRLVFQEAFILGLSADKDLAVGFQLGYNINRFMGDGDLRILVQSIMPFGLIDNSINSGYGLSIQYMIDRSYY